MIHRLFDLEFFSTITSRAAMAGIGAFLACLALGPRVIRWLRSKRVGEQVAKGESPALDRLMGHKKDTPTMGGVFVCAAALLALALLGNFRSRTLSIFAVTIGALGFLGAVDDYLKLTGKRRAGMSMVAKLIGQVLVGYGAGVWLYVVMLRTDPDHASRVYLPFDGFVDLGVWYPAFVMLVVTATSNAVNITDGLDGLAGGCLAIAVFAYATIAYVVHRPDFSGYLGLPHVRSAAETTVACTAILGATLGFLWFNGHPAQVFMGDSGSLPLGGALGLIACTTKQELILIVIGGVFVVEAGSSFVQILFYKLTGKRLFRIAPLHHHFQFAGLPETKITLRFWICAAVLAVASLATLKLR
ncbi:MAG: phospho-N-acetylmuramoyl-pentapeptide-transferase [Planctomycetes bacterium]|nr:phospho-N-acetylmuramoyl-pentapeptide-transferase [Planctomycetota bacterium]